MSVRMLRSLLLLLAASPAAWSQAAETTFVIDPAQTELTLSAGAFWSGGDPLMVSEQAAGSLTTSATGSLVADIQASSIELVNGSVVLDDSGVWLPGPAAGNFGFQADSGNVLIGAMTGAMRNASFSATAPSIATTPAGSGFTFPADGTTLTGATGRVDFDGGPEGTVLAGLVGVSQTIVSLSSTATLTPIADGSYENNAGVETLTLPVHVIYEEFLVSHDVAWLLEGTIVARYVPEPASAALMLAGSLIVLRRGRRGLSG